MQLRYPQRGRIARPYRPFDDEDYFGDDYGYGNQIFQVQRVAPEDRPQPITNPITANFLKEFMVDPLVVQAHRAPAVFSLMFRTNTRNPVF